MSAGILNFDNNQADVIEQGADFRFPFTYTDSVGAIVPLNTYTIKMQVRKNYDDTLIVEFTTENSNIVIDTNSEVTLTLTAAQTALLPAGNYVYDMKVISPSGFVTKLLKGKCIVEAEATV